MRETEFQGVAQVASNVYAFKETLEGPFPVLCLRLCRYPFGNEDGAGRLALETAAVGAREPRLFRVVLVS
jgi:hypothetical protein